MVYLATPYSHKLPCMQELRFQWACEIAAQLMREGKTIFSPIAHTHPIAMAGALPTDWAFWRKYDYEMLNACDSMIVVRMDGWEQSKGVQEEIRIMTELGKPIEYMDVPFHTT